MSKQNNNHVKRRDYSRLLKFRKLQETYPSETIENGTRTDIFNPVKSHYGRGRVQRWSRVKRDEKNRSRS